MIWSIRKSSLCLLAVGAAGCAFDAGGGPIEESITSTGEPIIGGAETFARPEVGQVYDGSLCTATLVDARYVLTAGHCSHWITGPYEAVYYFNDRPQPRAWASRKVDFSYALGGNGEIGPSDVALLRLETPVAPTEAMPALIASDPPAKGARVTAFGYGCQERGNYESVGVKKFYSWNWGNDTAYGCDGDSGGPVVLGEVGGQGGIFAVNSGVVESPDLGDDYHGDAWGRATPGLAAVRAFGGSYTTNWVHGGVPVWAQTSRARLLSGDFDGDGFGDVALAGGEGWETIPVARSKGPNGVFSVTNFIASDFPKLAASSGTKVVTGDFNGDGRTDIATPGHAGWGTIPIALSNGNGSFRFANPAVGSFPGWASESNVQVLAGDFDGDKRTDLALVGHAGWGTIPVAFSRMSPTGTGTFVVSNLAPSNTAFNVWAAQSNVKAVAGDFDGDGDDDIAITGHAGWETIPVAFSQRNGVFTVTNAGTRRFPSWAAESDVVAVAADFDADGDDDIAITGHHKWLTVPFALSRRNGTFQDANMPLQDMPTWSSESGVQVVATNVDRSDGADLVMAGGDGWETIPVTFLRK